MRHFSSAPVVGAMMLMAFGRAARADDTTEREDAAEYGREGTWEVGGSVSVDWTTNVLTIEATPTVGTFIRDRVELSVRLVAEYVRTKDDGVTTSERTGALVFEPSYHLPLDERLQVFVGLGLGPGYDGEHAEFEAIPRFGINIRVGRSGVLTPAVNVPILVGKSHGANDSVGVDVGVIVEAGFTTTL